MKVTFADLSPEEVNLVLAGLGKLPLELSVTLWAKLKQSAEQQLAPVPQPPESEPPA
ncbi:MAG: hypothetical protein ACYDBH_00465 [Acidobacteriaceae bacterium]